MRPAPDLDPILASMIDRVEERLSLLFSDRASCRTLIARGLAFRRSDSVENKLALLDADLFSEELLEALVCGGETYRPAPIVFIWQRLTESRIVVKVFGRLPGALADYQIDLALLREHLHADTFSNLFVPPSGLAGRYSGAVVATDVLKNGDERRGSGFIVQLDGGDSQFLVTCRHNVDPTDGISLMKVTGADGQPLSVGTPVLSPLHDIAFLPLRQSAASPVFRFSDAVSMFDDVYTLGFPHVAGARPVLLGHRGEVNGFADLYLQKCPAIVISNLVAPGSSGCPVLKRDGRCVGMTIRWLEGDLSGEKARFSAALPASALRDFLLSACSDSVG